MFGKNAKNRINKIAACLCLLALFCVLFAGSAYAQESGSGSEPQSEAASQPGQGAEVPESPPTGSLYTPEDFEVQAEGVYLVNEDSGAVVYQKNADQQFTSASLVKMMTCILLLEHAEDLDAPTIPAARWVFNELTGKNASHADIRYGEVLTARELLYAMLLPSANEAALITAEYVSSGYIPNFLYAMNGKAKALGCTGTNFADPNGLSEESVTTPRDMYLIAQEFMRHPVLVEIAATSTYEMPAHETHTAAYNIFTTNRLLVASDAYSKAFPKIQGAVKAGKTGSLGEWQNFVSLAEKDGEQYLCVVLHSPNAADEVAEKQNAARFRPALYESARLYNWVFENYTVKSALDTTQPITEVRVKYSSDQDSVRLLPTSDIKTVLPKDGTQEVEKTFQLPAYVEAPVKEGDVVGSVTLSIAGQQVGSAQLAAAQSVKRNTVLYLLEKIKGFLGSRWFVFILVAVLLLAGAYIALVMARYRKRQEKEMAAARRTQSPPGPPGPAANNSKTRRQASPADKNNRPKGGRRDG